MYSKVWTREYYLGKFVSIYFLFNYCNLKDFYLTVLLLWTEYSIYWRCNLPIKLWIKTT